MLCVVCVISWAALANGFTLVLGFFYPQVTEGSLQQIVVVGLMTTMALINVRGAKLGGMISTVCSVAKLIPLIAFVLAGVYAFDSAKFVPFAPQGYGNLADGVLLLLYALVGFESSVVPAGEMENPKKAVPLSLISVMSLVCIIYTGVFIACISLHPELAGSKAPVAEAAVEIFGEFGSKFIALGIVISVLGINAAQALVGPRKVYAMAERGDLPSYFAKVDPKTGVPARAIWVTYAVAVALALSGSFAELAKLGVLARFVQYIATCGAVFVFRARDKGGEPQGFRVPGGPIIAAVTIGLILWLMFNTPTEKLLWGLVAMALSLPFYVLKVWSNKKTQ